MCGHSSSPAVDAGGNDGRAYLDSLAHTAKLLDLSSVPKALELDAMREKGASPE